MRIPLEFLVIDSGSGFDPVQLKLEPEIAHKKDICLNYDLEIYF